MCAFSWCPREDLNLHALAGTGPQPAAYASSATGARECYYTGIRIACQFARKPAPLTALADERCLATGKGIPNANLVIAYESTRKRIRGEKCNLQRLLAIGAQPATYCAALERRAHQMCLIPVGKGNLH